MCECVTVCVCMHAHTFLPADVCKFMCVGVQFVCVCLCVPSPGSVEVFYSL